MKGAKPALQTRSQQTRDKLVAALERLLRDKAFENISVAEIAREAGVSVGAVYTRFENKDAFIPVLRVGAQFMAREAHLMRAAHLYAHTRPDLIGDGWEAISEAGRYPDLGPPAPRGLSLEALAEELADFAWGYLTAPRD